MYKTYIKPALTLTIITVIVALALALTYSITSQKLNSNNPPVSSGEYITTGTDSYKNVLPDANFFIFIEQKDIGSSEGVSVVVKGESAKGVPAGYVMTVSGRGYSPRLIQADIGIGSDGKVKGLEILSENETPGIGDNIKSANFLKSYIGTTNAVIKNLKNPNRANVITGATYSSRGVFSIVKAALNRYTQLAGGA
jgi:electron transport complex protein RnfG